MAISSRLQSHLAADHSNFATCRIDFHKYPQNLPSQHIIHRKLKSYVEQLDQLQEDLFDDERPSLDFLDLYHESNDFVPVQAQSLDMVRKQCLFGNSREGADNFRPLQCRFLFLYSRNSREALYTTRDMLSLALSHHMVQPWILEFLFCFGEQDEPRDFRFSAFRSRSFLGREKALQLPSLRRSGSEFHLCYNLKSVEKAKGPVPWSIRQTVIYHIFDVGTGQTFWLVLKGNDSLCQDLKRTAPRRQWQQADKDESLRSSFRSSLDTHVAMCEWACENWRTYINYIEAEMGQLTDEGLIHEVGRRAMPKSFSRAPNPTLQKTSTWNSLKHKILPRTPNSGFRDNSDISLESLQDEAAQPAENFDIDGNTMPFEFTDLQRVQFTEEKASEALYTIQNDIKIVRNLENFYKTLFQLPEHLQDELPDFLAALDNIVKDLEMWTSTLETLIRKFSERKSLMFAILDFHNMQANLYFAAKAQVSASRMEALTEETKILTKKTKRETVSMKVIAGVTMFFLPGTFVSTLMSTDVVKWQLDDNGDFVKQAAPGAAYLFLELTLPLMLGTFVAWLIASWWYNNRDDG